MTAPNGFFVDANSTITPRSSLSVDPTTGAPSINTVDSNGNPVVTACGGGGGGGSSTFAGLTDKVTAAIATINDSVRNALQTLTTAVGLRAVVSATQVTQQGAGATTALLDTTKKLLKDPAGGTDIPIAPINGNQVTQLAASATVAILNSGKSALKDPAGGADIPLGGTVATTWQTYTPSGTNTVHIAMDRASGPNVMLSSPADNTQVVDVPLNMADGAEMQINLVGGGASGSWTVWASGAPTTPGWVFLSGAAPTAPASATNYLRIIAKRRGVKYECDIAPFNANAIV